jgi:Fe-S-cluster containining protein
VDHNLDAGEFSGWLAEMRAALRGAGTTDVPCDGCTACCTSSQFVHIAPDEAATLAVIPAELLFPAPGLPRGHVLMGYDERGHCPMLVDERCSIYAHRPRTCRTYDCRIFAATGIELEDPTKVAIAERTARWRFRYDSPAAHAEHDALREHARGVDGASETARALAAVSSRTPD